GGGPAGRARDHRPALDGETAGGPPGQLWPALLVPGRGAVRRTERAAAPGGGPVQDRPARPASPRAAAHRRGAAVLAGQRLRGGGAVAPTGAGQGCRGPPGGRARGRAVYAGEDSAAPSAVRGTTPQAARRGPQGGRPSGGPSPRLGVVH